MQYDNGMRHVVVQLADRATLERLTPDLAALAQQPADTIDVFHAEGSGAHLRVFAPAHGVPEDPGTGSAAAPLLCHLVEHAGFDPKRTLLIQQGDAMNRASRLQVRFSPASDGFTRNVEVGGAGIIVATGEFRLMPLMARQPH